MSNPTSPRSDSKSSNPTSPRSDSKSSNPASPKPDSKSSIGGPEVILLNNSETLGKRAALGNNLISLNASSQIPFKLTNGGGNYASWKSQMTNLLFGYDLLGFVDGSRLCPPKTDPEHNYWLRQDRLVLLGIQATVHSTISPTINNCISSAEAWNKLETSYANRSNTRMLSLLSTLMKTTKEGLSVAEYMTKIKGLIDDLALIGHPLRDEEIIAHTLNGLETEFKELTAAIRVRDSTITFEALHDKLLDEEMIQKRGENKKLETPITAQFSQKGNNRNKGTQNKGFQYNNKPFQGTFPGQQPTRPPHTHDRGFNPQGISYNSCSPNTTFWRPNYQSGQPKPICQLCDKIGHTAKTCRSKPKPNFQHTWPQANVITGESSSSTGNWVLDSGATHHITSDLQNLSMHSDYVGNEDVIVGNGFEHRGILGPRPE